MARSLTVKNLYEKTFDTFSFDGIWQKAMGNPEKAGSWIVYGAEKNGKTWVSLKLAEYLSTFEKTLYISAEEGTRKAFIDACRRAKVCVTSRRLQFLSYIPLDELKPKLKSRKGARIVVVDNLTVYDNEIKASEIGRLMREFPNILWVFVAHEEKGEPYMAAGKMAKKLAEIVIRVRGLTAHISGRCPGGNISIDETKAALYWGMPVEP